MQKVRQDNKDYQGTNGDASAAENGIDENYSPISKNAAALKSAATNYPLNHPQTSSIRPQGPGKY